MKLFKYGLPLAALAVLASCSNDKLDAPENEAPKTPVEGAMYTAIQINLPSTAGTRAVSYEDGENSQEWAASSGYLALFEDQGGYEDDFVCIDVQPLSSLAWTQNKTPNDITSVSTTATAVFEKLELEYDLYGLVILNAPNNNFLPSKDQTFGAWKNTEFEAGANPDIKSPLGDGATLGKFTMTNAPQYAPSSSNYAETLVAIPASSFKSSISELDKEGNPKFYVQRIVAKVTLADGTETGKKFDGFNVTTKDGKATGEKVVIKNWALNYTNNYTYPVQVVGGNDKVSETFYIDWEGSKYGITPDPFYSTAQTFNRIWWGIDPNYEGTDGTYTTSGESDSFTTTLTNNEVSQALDYVAYPLENTMSYKNMTEGQSTFAILKGEFILEGEESAKSFVSYGVLKVAVDDITINANTSGKYKLSALATDAQNKTDLTDLMGKLGVTSDEIEVEYYKDGVCYYPIIIRHFDDTECPLDRDEWKENGYMYGDYAYNTEHIGRFGLLRNNWYQISIKSISGVGTPDIPTPDPGDPDDPKDDKYYINASINILAWGVRNFGYDL